MNKSLAIVVAGFLVGCGGSAKKTISIGAVFPLTGSGASYGTDDVDALTVGIEEINAAGGILGSDLKLIVKDDTSDAAKAKAMAEELMADKVPVVLGSVYSSASLAMAEVTVPNKVVQISGSSTSPLLTSYADDGYLFRTISSDAFQGKLLAKRARAQSISKAAIVYVPNAYGKGLADAFDTAFTAAGGTVTYRAEYVEGRTSYTDLLTPLYATNPEAVVLIAYTVEGATIISDYVRDFIQKNTTWYFSEALQSLDFINQVGPSKFTFAHEGTGLSVTLGARFDTYKAAFKKKNNRDAVAGNGAENTYDALYLAALAMEAAGSADGTAIRDQLSSVSSGGTKYGASEIAQALEDIRAKKDVDYEGVSGQVDFDANGDVVAPYAIWKVSSGALFTVEPAVSL